jgi:Zn-dependent membrane protease YugP
MGLFFYDSWFILLVVPAIIFSIFAQVSLKSTYSKYSKIKSQSGMTGAEAAEQILRANNINNVRVERIAGNLTDHYSPKEQVIRLSDGVYNSTSIAALGIAAHESGHAVQYSAKYFPITVRNAIIPITNIGSTLSYPLILMGIILSMPSLISLGIILFAVVVLFQLITLPVEFNASGRAVKALDGA